VSAPPGVLIVDQGVSFGGSALVASVIANRMPVDRFRVHLAAAIDPALLRIEPAASARVKLMAKPYSYVDQARVRSRLSGRPTAFRRAASWADTVARLWRNRRYTRELIAWIRSARIDLVHLNNGFENLEAHLAARATRSRVIVHAHGGCGSAFLTRRLARGVPACVAISGPVADSLRAIGVPERRIALLPNPLTVTPNTPDEHARRRARSAHGIPTDWVLAGSVGRIVEWKGQLEFLRAAAAALRKVPQSGVVIIGDVTDASEAYGEQLHQEVQTLGLSGRVWFTGFINNPLEVYSLFDVLVHSAIEPEPFGLVLTEAMAHGIPVIAAASGGPMEIIRDGVDGYLRDPRDTEKVGALLAAMLQDPLLRDRIGAAGRAMVETRFDPDQYVARMADVYDAVLSGTS
jgi:glycosyltransferase involved in cell wall biosynthesis